MENVREIYEKIRAGEDLRANLIELKRQLGEEETREAFRAACGDNYDVIMKCLAAADPKARKNAADILGILKVQEAADVLMDAYREEETLYVRPDYVTALAALDCSAFLEELRQRLDMLRACAVPENEKKHVQAEIRALQELLLAKEGVKKHSFTGYNRSNETLLTTLPAFREILAADLPFRTTVRPGGVALTISEMNVALESRYWQEMLFVVHDGADLLTILRENHRGADPYYFRVGVTGAADRKAGSLLAKQAARAIEAAMGGSLINSASHYEAEIRLAMDPEGGVTPYLKLFTLPDTRFRYRRYSVAAGMKPFVAAGLIGLSKPYFRDHAQILDPFCGVGTLLIERRFAGPVRSAYGTDTFGEAIDKARRNARIAGVPVNFINRDFFSFTHDYLFDEILTDLPERIGDREETDAFYGAFLVKSAELLSEKGRVFCYTAETGMLKKHLRLCGRFRLLAEFPILSRGGTALFILERKG